LAKAVQRRTLAELQEEVTQRQQNGGGSRAETSIATFFENAVEVFSKLLLMDASSTLICLLGKICAITSLPIT